MSGSGEVLDIQYVILEISFDTFSQNPDPPPLNTMLDVFTVLVVSKQHRIFVDFSLTTALRILSLSSYIYQALSYAADSELLALDLEKFFRSYLLVEHQVV